MKIVTWNINSVRLRIDLLASFNEIHSPDIVCLQETKTSDETFPFDGLQSLGFEHIVFSGQKSYNGVAILSKKPIQESFSLEFYNEDKRHIAAKIDGIEVHNFYIPAGGDEPDEEINPKFKHKLEFIKLMQEWLTQNRSPLDNLILVGDLNIAPHEHDVWSSKQLKRVVSHTDIERKMLIDLQNSMNFIDSGRHFVPFDQKLYSWWSYRTPNWEKSDRGRRLDHIWVSQPLKDRLLDVVSLREARGWDRPSDHVPFILSMK